MAHCLSAEEIKRGRASGAARDCPRAGTKIRSLYDLLMQSKGKAITLDYHLYGHPASMGYLLECLRNSYGLDIRRIPGSGSGRRGSPGMMPNQYILVGEWIGKVYIDYVAEQLEQKVVGATDTGCVYA
jgi:hypothetical protein